MSDTTIIPLGVFDIVDAAHPTQLDWRRIEISVLVKEKKSFVYSTLSNKKDGRHPHELYECPQFQGALRRLVFSIFVPVFPHTFKDFNRGGGYGRKNEQARASYSHTIHDDLDQNLRGLTAHAHLALLNQANIIRNLEANRKELYSPKKVPNKATAPRQKTHLLLV